MAPPPPEVELSVKMLPLTTTSELVTETHTAPPSPAEAALFVNETPWSLRSPTELEIAPPVDEVAVLPSKTQS